MLCPIIYSPLYQYIFNKNSLYIYIYIYNGYSVHQWPRRPGFNLRSSHSKNSKNDTTLLKTQHYKVQIKGKWSNLEKEVALSSTPLCSSYWKESSGQPQQQPTYLYIYIYIYIYIYTLFQKFDIIWDLRFEIKKILCSMYTDSIKSTFICKLQWGFHYSLWPCILRVLF